MSLFRRRTFNADSVTVGHSEQPGLSRMTFVINADDETVEQVSKQLYKLLEVLKVTDITVEPHVRRELALIKVNATAQNRADIMQLTDIFHGQIVDVSHNQVVIEFSGPADKIDSFLGLLQPFDVLAIVMKHGVVERIDALEIFRVEHVLGTDAVDGLGAEIRLEQAEHRP